MTPEIYECFMSISFFFKLYKENIFVNLEIY